jgi:hypothetical protein
MPALAAKNSATALPPEPRPGDTYSMPSEDFAHFMNSSNVFTPADGWTTNAFGEPPMKATCVNSFIGSKPTFLLMAGASTCVPQPVIIKVCPSGSDRATFLAAMAPPAPVVFSI